MSTTLQAPPAVQDPRRYFESVQARDSVAEAMPVCLYLEVTNRCNLLCETCPRTFEALEPPADMSMELFRRIVDQVPNVARVVLHGVGEPMLVKHLPDMIRYLKQPGTQDPRPVQHQRHPARPQEAPGDHRHRPRRAARVAGRRRGRDLPEGARQGHVRPHRPQRVSAFTNLQAATGATKPLVSLWLTGLKETVDQLPEFVRLAARIGVKEVHLQRLVFDEAGFGMARPDSSLFEQTRAEEEAIIAAATAIGRSWASCSTPPARPSRA